MTTRKKLRVVHSGRATEAEMLRSMKTYQLRMLLKRDLADWEERLVREELRRRDATARDPQMHNRHRASRAGKYRRGAVAKMRKTKFEAAFKDRPDRGKSLGLYARSNKKTDKTRIYRGGGLLKDRYEVYDEETGIVVGHVRATWVVGAGDLAKRKYGPGVSVRVETEGHPTQVGQRYWDGARSPKGREENARYYEERIKRRKMQNDPARPRRLPGPKPKMTYAVYHPVTGAKKVYKGLKNKDLAHRQAMAWAKRYRKSVRLTVLSSNARGARPFSVTAKGKWVSKYKGATKPKKRSTKATRSRRKK